MAKGDKSLIGAVLNHAGEFLGEKRGSVHSKGIKKMITAEEKQKRQDDWDYVVASIELECGPFIHNFDPLMEKYINGEITLEEKNRQWHELGRKLMKHAEI